MRVIRVAAVAVPVAAMGAVLVWIADNLGYVQTVSSGPYLAAVGVLWVCFAGAAIALRWAPERAVVPLVVVGGLVIGLAAMTGPPNTSTDSARYAWDGIVADAGVSPYAYVPADPALQALRPAWLFPATGADGSCPAPPIMVDVDLAGTSTLCTAINRSHVHTIYPPAAEALFAAARAFVPSSVEYVPIQALGLVAAVGTTLLLLFALRRFGLDPRHAAWWAWCPLVATDGITNAHIDIAAAFLALLAAVLAASGRPIRAGIALGIAFAVKFLPVLIAPAMVRRGPVRIVVAAVVTVAALYAPFVLGGSDVLGYLPGYLHEEGYESGSRSVLLAAVLPPATSTVVAAVLVAVVAVVVLIRTAPTNPWAGQAAVIGAALLALSPSFGWYALLLIPFIAMSGRWEWFGLVLALSARTLTTSKLLFQIDLLTALAIVLIAALFRWRFRRRAVAGS